MKAKSTKNNSKEVMLLAWQLVKRNGYPLRHAMHTAWLNRNLRAAMAERIVKFYFRRVDGSIREAYGTLADRLLPPREGGARRRPNDSVQVYFDTEQRAFRSFKKANLLHVVSFSESTF